MRFDRTLRISEEIKKLVSQMLQVDIKDPGISSLIRITRVETTNDLRFVNIYISVLGDDEKAHDTLAALTRAKGFIRKAIGNNISLRYTPEPIFKLDTSIEHSVRMSQLINEVKKTHGPEETQPVDGPEETHDDDDDGQDKFK